MAGKSKVAEAYAEVSADTSKLKAGMGAVPGLLKGAMGALAAATGITLGLKAAFDFLHGSVTKALGGSKADFKLEQIVRGTGEAAGWTVDQLKAMQELMAKDTGFSRKDIASA